MKKLLLSTALVAVTSVPAVAQGSDEMFRQEASPTDLHASNFIGMRVYRTDAVDAEAYEGVQDTWEDIGEIHDLVLSRDGSVEAVLVDIGGFLGIGENQVAVDMDAIQFVSDSATPDEESDFFLVLNAPRGALEEAPTYGMMGGDQPMAEEENAASDTSETTTEDTAATTGATAESDEEMAATSEEVETPSTPDTSATGDQTASNAGISREGYVTAGADELVADELTGAAAYDANDKQIGEVSDLLISEDGKIQSAIVDVGGFLGIGAKPVALEMSKLDILRAEDGSDVRVYISATEEELEALPEYEG